MTLLGRNGMGKTTTIRTIMGLRPRAPGTCGSMAGSVGNRRRSRGAPGIGLVPEGRRSSRR